MRVTTTTKITDEKFINLYESKYTHKDCQGRWIFASRKNQNVEAKTKPDAVVIIGTLGQDTYFQSVQTEHEKIVLIKQFRVPLNGYELGFPAGLIDEGETPGQAAIREFKEETGLGVVRVLDVSPPLCNSAGLSDESVVCVFVEAYGEISTEFNEADEDIEVLALEKGQIQQEIDKGSHLGAKCWMYLKMSGRI
jgi:ADP-ribose pyrophosphatase